MKIKVLFQTITRLRVQVEVRVRVRLWKKSQVCGFRFTFLLRIVSLLRFKFGFGPKICQVQRFGFGIGIGIGIGVRFWIVLNSLVLVQVLVFQKKIVFPRFWVRVRFGPLPKGCLTIIHSQIFLRFFAQSSPLMYSSKRPE